MVMTKKNNVSGLYFEALCNHIARRRNITPTEVCITAIKITNPHILQDGKLMKTFSQCNQREIDGLIGVLEYEVERLGVKTLK